MGTLYDPVESDLASYQMTFILSPELWEKFNLEGINVDYSKWARVKMMDADKELSDETNRIPNDCGGIYVYVIVSPIIPNGGSVKEQEIIIPLLKQVKDYYTLAEEAGVTVPEVRRKASRIHCELISYMENYFIEKL